MSTELNARSAPLGRSPPSKCGSISRPKLTELRPKGALVIPPATPTDLKRKQHAQAQKQQRDRLKCALDRIAHMLEGGGVQAGTGATKAELVEAAVEYIQKLQGQVEELRGHATDDSR
ncbi:hypothetical protein BDW62DRAFT_197291 [Aspergillus aurantiobrunneus]